jgi:hypothetical protein
MLQEEGTVEGAEKIVEGDGDVEEGEEDDEIAD